MSVAVAAPTTRRSNKLLRVIAVFKFVETAVVFGAGLAAVKLLNPATLDALSAWTQMLPAVTEQRLAGRVLSHLSGVTPREVKELGAGAFLLAATFLMEGIGLWLEKRWAEWLSVVATALFIPLEVLEITRHATAPKVIALVLNTLIVGYLIARIVTVKPGFKHSHGSSVA